MVRAGTVNAGMVTNGGSVKPGMVKAGIVNVPVGPPGGAVVVVPNCGRALTAAAIKANLAN